MWPGNHKICLRLFASIFYLILLAVKNLNTSLKWCIILSKTGSKKLLPLLYSFSLALHRWPDLNMTFELIVKRVRQSSAHCFETLSLLKGDYSNATTAHSTLLPVTLIGGVRSTSLLKPRSPLWQFSKSNANPIAGLSKTVFHIIDCHSQLWEWGKGRVFTSNLRLEQAAPKAHPAESDQRV